MTADALPMRPAAMLTVSLTPAYEQLMLLSLVLQATIVRPGTSRTEFTPSSPSFHDRAALCFDARTPAQSVDPKIMQARQRALKVHIFVRDRPLGRYISIHGIFSYRVEAFLA